MSKETLKHHKSFAPRKTAQPGAVDKHVGARMRVRRSVLGLSQERLGEAVGLTFQQVQKYEHGVNRISASRLLALSRALDVDVSYFFEGLCEQNTSAALSLCEERGQYDLDPLERRETYDLIRAYYHINDAQVRSRFLDLLRAFSMTGSTVQDVVSLFAEKEVS
ncbi:MAG: helix-turn-helix transcriptional regulator [Holosporales bacterium]|jgi:transcriptional regulator with XRE-family HTH domain|nr:helix-turn-helix transcriptional regulator [Holosporales bacterium]